MLNHNPIEQVSNKNPWYVNDQFKSQFSRYGSRKTIEKRWVFFDKEILQYMENKEEQKITILDAGCGDGINISFLIKFLEQANIIAGDYNIERLKKVKKRFSDKIEILEIDLLNITQERKFDIILLSQVLEHIKEDDLVLKNLHNILVPNGVLIIGVPNEGCFFAKIRNNYINKNIARNTDHVNFYTEKKIREKIHSNGYKILRRSYDGTIFLPHQYLQILFSKAKITYHILDFFGKLIKSQTSGYYFSCKKGNFNEGS